MQPLVSIVITSYNGDKYLAEQLESIIGQTYPSLEIIISDDASTDDTWAIAQRYATQDARIVLVRHEKNVGLHANLGGALERANGEFIAISDQDDIWRPDKIEKQLALLNGAVGVYSDSALIDAKGNSLGFTLFQSLNISPGPDISRTVPLFFKNAVSGHALLFHRSLLSMVLPFTDDFIFDHQLALAASCFGGLRFLMSHWYITASTAATTPMQGLLGNPRASKRLLIAMPSGEHTGSSSSNVSGMCWIAHPVRVKH